MKKSLIILLIIITVVLFSSCDTFQKQIKEESVEKIVSKIIGEEVDVTIITPTPDPNSTQAPTQSPTNIIESIVQENEEGQLEWPDEIPDSVPVLDKGIHGKMKTPNGVILDFDNTELSTVEDYASKLKQKMYEIIREDKDSKKFDASYRKNDIIVNVYWYKSGSLSIMITW